MSTDYKKYILSTGTHYISNSGSDENGHEVALLVYASESMGV